MKYSWSNIFAYGVGLFTADGCLSSDSRHFEFTSKDKEQVQNFRKSFNFSNEITMKSRAADKIPRYYRIQFGNVGLFSFFENIGITKKKSLTIAKVNVPDCYYFDFLRGYLDGDGSISYYHVKNSEKKQVKTRFASGSLRFLEWIKQENSKLLGCAGSIQEVTRAYQLCYSKRDSLVLLDATYSDFKVLSLSRKKDLARAIIKENLDFNPEKWHNRYTKISRSGEIGKLASLRN